ncbi:MAG: MFS transporter permease [Desulfatitalea sp.]
MAGDQLPQVVIPKEEAVFWMDRFGQWYNASGRFRHKKIIDYFNASIRKDELGYFVEQIRESVYEKVYFRYEDTPLFVVEASDGDPIELVLNTRETLLLLPDQLFIREDNLYQQRDGECIRFSDRVLLQLSAHIDYDGEHYFFQAGEVRRLLPER